MKRIYHPWNKWEDYKHGFHGGMKYSKDNTLESCANLLRDLSRFEAALTVVINEWKYSCEHNLTNEDMNRVAYLGQAACALMYNVPNSVSMASYNLLTVEEQQAADAMAQKYLDIWLTRRTDVDTKKVL